MLVVVVAAPQILGFGRRIVQISQLLHAVTQMLLHMLAAHCCGKKVVLLTGVLGA